MLQLNQTHNPDLTSWVVSANSGDCDFPIQNLPFAIFRVKDSGQAFRAGVAIGDQILDMAAAAETGIFSSNLEDALGALSETSLNRFMQMGSSAWTGIRSALSSMLSTDSEHQATLGECLVNQSDVEYSLPAQIGDYTDFYTSIHHATNVGKLFRPDNPLLPNYEWIPIGYHGRSSSIGVSGQEFHRPKGQLKAPDADVPVLAPCKRLDYELEVGVFVGPGNELGKAIPIDQAEDHVFGLCLLNDWSARDIQAWEYQPLGPFLSKSFASTVSPWLVTMEALAPFRKAWLRDAPHPQPLSYLDSETLRGSGAVDMKLEVLIETQTMRHAGLAAQRIGLSNFDESYWSVAQMVTHHSVNGCNLKAGDLLGSGTISGTTENSYGALLEATVGGKHPITLNNGEQRTFLEDGDTIILKAWCDNQTNVRIGFGEAKGSILPAN
jgi:fumarylacetoacetase